MALRATLVAVALPDPVPDLLGRRLELTSQLLRRPAEANPLDQLAAEFGWVGRA